MRILLSGGALSAVVLVSLLLFFGLIILLVVLAKKKFTSLQIKKEDFNEEDEVKQELDRVLVYCDEELEEKDSSEKDSL